MKALVGAGLAFALATLATRPADACNGRPTDPAGYQGYSYGAAEVKSFATADVRVHYATSGDHMPFLTSKRADNVPDSVAFAAEVAQTSLAKFAELGFKKIPGDGACTSNGGDDKLDIYLVKFAGADGSTAPEDCKGNVCSSFFLVDSTFTRYPTPEEGFKTVVSHELFHGVQNAYNKSTERFWAEGTAQWAMKRAFPEVGDFERQLPAFFNEPQRSLDSPPGGVTAGFLYGSSVWPLFLELRHGAETVREIFELEEGGAKTLEATDSVLGKKGSSLADAFPLFSAWNVATGKTYTGEGGYPDAAKYPGIKTKALSDGIEGITSGLSSFAYVGKLEGKQGVTLDTDATRNAGLLVPIEGGKLKLGNAQKLPANAEGNVLVIVAGTTTKKTDAKFTLHVGEPVTQEADAGASSGGGSSSGDDGCACANAPRTGDGLSAFVLVVFGALISRSRSRKR